jgi:hypothetical protein
MFKRNPIKLSLIVIVAFMGAVGCSTNSSSDSQSATIKGSVDANSAKQKTQNSSLQGTVVTASRVTSNGSIKAIEGAKTETNASGEFTLNVDVESAEHVIIVAENEGSTWKGYLSSEVKNGGSFTLKPINTESTAESEVYTKLVASGDADIVQKSDVEAVVSSETASEIETGLTTAGEVATALSNSAKARAEFYTETMQDNAEQSLQETYDYLAEAQFKLESDLAASSSAEERSEAYDVFIQSSVNAYINAGLSASNTAQVLDMWSRVAVNSMTAVSSDIKEDVRMHSSLMAATAIDMAVQAEAEASDMSESSIQAIIDAGIQLRSDIKSSTGIEGDVEAAFEAYHDSVRNTMESDASFEANVMVNIDNKINSNDGAKSNFSSSISSVLKASAVFNIYNSFYSSIEETVNSSMSGSSDSEIKAVSSIMFLINLAS